jgi:hypothetical protein
MTTRALLTVLLTLLLLPAAATAKESPAGSARWDGESYHYDGERLANNAEMTDQQAWAVDFWRDRNVDVCKGVSIWLAPDLGAGILASADTKHCRMTVLTRVIRATQVGHMVDRLTARLQMCVAILHETGHLGGLAVPKWNGQFWEDTHPAKGIMSADGGSTSDVWSSNGRAYGSGACGVRTAAWYNQLTGASAHVSKRSKRARKSRKPRESFYTSS